ncbi:hypothetical protein M513_11453 [Trichuris suis]|uniref:Reverse transcriptase domain-containing protein n=1 Tax=Trichuris suis TaxID=68888 RepID=A0A085LRR6_9BILA|nr:hypothetical protein M513_11453 [Trichuris suis]
MQEGNYFLFDNKFYKQSNGVPMGSPLSPVMAEIFMESFERQMFEKVDRQIAPRLFKRYVDDIFVIIRDGKEEQFLHFLNSIRPNQTAFTMEKEENKTLAFLDALIIRTNQGLKTRVYRKPTHTDKYLDFSSHHPRSVMRGILSGMIDRAVNLCTPEYLQPELNYIRKIFYKNNYPRSFIDRVFQYKLHNRESAKPNTLHNPHLVIPYLAGLSEKIIRLGRRIIT